MYLFGAIHMQCKSWVFSLHQPMFSKLMAADCQYFNGKQAHCSVAMIVSIASDQHNIRVATLLIGIIYRC